MSCGVRTLTSLFSFYRGLFINTFDNLSFYGDDVAKIRRYKESRNLSRLKEHPLWLDILNYCNFDEISAMKGCLDYDAPLPHRMTVKRSKVGCEKWHKRQMIKYLQKAKENGWDLKYIGDFLA